MKFSCLTKELYSALSILSKVAIKNPNNPLLENVFLKVENHSLILRGSNIEVFLEKNIPIKGEVNGAVLVKSSLITKIVGTVAKENQSVTFEKQNNILLITTETEEFELDISEEEQFPSLPQSESTLFTADKKMFTDTLKSVLFCAATSDIKPEIASVFVYSQNGEMVTVATDSYRLAEKKASIQLPESVSLLLPSKNTILIMSILDDLNDTEIVVDSYKDGVIFNTKDTFVSTRVINGTFPDYRQLFPKEFSLEIKLQKELIVNALQLSTYITTQYVFCNLKIDQEKSSILFSSKEKSVGAIKKTLPIEIEKKGDGMELDINYNSNYFLEGLQKIDNSTLNVKFTTPQRPLFITNPSDTSFTYLLMPLNR